jgi:hypothetical protein
VAPGIDIHFLGAVLGHARYPDGTSKGGSGQGTKAKVLAPGAGT